MTRPRLSHALLPLALLAVAACGAASKRPPPPAVTAPRPPLPRADWDEEVPPADGVDDHLATAELDCSSAPTAERPAEIKALIEREGFAALPCLWKQLGVRRLLDEPAIGDRVGCLVKDSPPCVSMETLPASPHEGSYVIVRIHRPHVGEVQRYLAFREGGGRARFLGAFEEKTHWLIDEPPLRLERFGGRGPFVALELRPHCGLGCSDDHETWFDLEHAEQGTLKKVLQYDLTRTRVTTLSPVLDEVVTGRIVGHGVERGEAAVDVYLEEAHVGFVDRSLETGPVAVPIFTRRGVVRYVYDPAQRAFVPDPVRSTWARESRARNHRVWPSSSRIFPSTCLEMIEDCLPDLLDTVKRGGPERRRLVEAFVKSHRDDPDCGPSAAFTVLQKAL